MQPASMLTRQSAEQNPDGPSTSSNGALLQMMRPRGGLRSVALRGAAWRSPTQPRPQGSGPQPLAPQPALGAHLGLSGAGARAGHPSDAQTDAGLPDASLVLELEDALALEPSNHETRLVLAEYLVGVGWYEAARAHVDRLVQQPAHVEAANRLKTTIDAGLLQASAPAQADDSERIAVPDDAMPGPSQSDASEADASCAGPSDPVAFLAEAKALHADVIALEARLAVLRELGFDQGGDWEASALWVNAFATGRATAAPVHVTPAQVADAAREDAAQGLALAVTYLKQIVDANAPSTGGPACDDNLRRVLLAQVAVIAEASGDKDLGRDALMHLEHEVLKKAYSNKHEIFSMEPLESIPRERFIVCEDNTAYDMAELVQWLASQGTTWIHPASRAPLSLEDTRDVLRHNLGAPLAIKRATNERMVRNISRSTLEHLRTLGQAMLDDQSEDFKSSHVAIAWYRQYLLRLPAAERSAVRDVQMSARDAHTLRTMQGTPAGFLQDFESNVMCGHKVGQFLRDAANKLLGQV